MNEPIIIPADTAALVRCDLEWGVRAEEYVADDGSTRIRLRVNQHPETTRHTSALNAFMEETAIAWLQQVAPHRLAPGFTERAEGSPN